MAIVNSAGTSVIGVTEGSGASVVVLVAMIILFGGAASASKPTRRFSSTEN